MNITIAYTCLADSKYPVVRTFEGVRKIRLIKGTLTFECFDKHISGFRLVHIKPSEFLYFTVDY